MLSWLKQKQMFPFRLADLPYCDVLRKNNLYCSIADRVAWKYDPQRWIAVFVRHNQLQATGVLDSVEADAEASRQAAQQDSSHRFPLWERND
jgi:hypothetical protein